MANIDNLGANHEHMTAQFEVLYMPALYRWHCTAYCRRVEHTATLLAGAVGMHISELP
jgi:hypothetical protein